MKRIALSVVAISSMAMPITGNSAVFQQQECYSSECAKKEVVDKASKEYGRRTSDPDQMDSSITLACYFYLKFTEPSDYRYKQIASTYPPEECKKDAREKLLVIIEAEKIEAAEAVEKEKKRAEAELQKKQIAEEEAQREEQRKSQHEADLRAGKVKPQNLGEAVIVYGAADGEELASAPKIKPDGKVYYITGKISISKGVKPEFMAQLSFGDQKDALLRYAGYSSKLDSRYFYVKIPKSLQSYYYDQAKIGGFFVMVGKYVANTGYKTVAGQQKSAPVFEAVYFEMQKE